MHPKIPSATEKGTGKEGQLDDVLLKLGSPGRYHVICYLLLWCCNAFVAFNHVSLPSTFGITPSHRCALQNGRPNTSELWRNTSHLYIAEKCEIKQNRTKQKCEKWIFDKVENYHVSSIVTEWNLVCDNNFYPMVSTTVYFIGVMIGGGTIGRVSDRYGRRPVLLISLGLAIIFFAVASLIKNFILFTLLRFFGGIFACGVHSIVYVMTPELAPKKHNNYLSLLLIFSFLTSVAAGGGICWATKSWWQSQLYTSLSLVIPLCLMYFFLPESFRWLVVHKKYTLLNQYLTKAANMNNVTLLSLSVIHSGETIKGVKPINRKRISTKKLFSYKELRRRLLAMFFAWTSAAIGYYTLSLSMESVSSDPYLAVMIGACFDTVPVVIAFFTLNRLGKRRVILAFMIIGSLLCISYKIFNHIALLLAGKMFFAPTFGLVYVYCVDLFPTIVRNLCVGLCVTVCRMGSVLAPQLILLGVYTSPDVPILISGIIMLMAAVVIYFMPELTNQPLPDTIEDVENFKENKKKLPVEQEIKTISNLV